VLNQRFCPPIRTLLLQSQTPRPFTRTGPRLSWFRFFAAKTISNLHSSIEIPYISPHPPQTLAAQFKRPYRNCPNPTNLGIPSFLLRGSPDRDLSFTGTDRGLLRSVLGPWSPVPKCEAPGAPISSEEHTSMAPRPRRQSQNPPLQKSSAIPALPWPSKSRLRYSPGLAPTTRLNALLNAASDS
jgi:hypothetical protein